VSPFGGPWCANDAAGDGRLGQYTGNAGNTRDAANARDGDACARGDTSARDRHACGEHNAGNRFHRNLRNAGIADRLRNERNGCGQQFGDWQQFRDWRHIEYR
jgi:hypothetical protein